MVRDSREASCIVVAGSQHSRSPSHRFAGGAEPARAQNSEVVTLLQDLVRINTSNPPGNEALVAELLRTRLEPLGFQVEIVPTPTTGKAHLIARLPATAPDGRKPLLLAGHEDVVGVERPLWTVDPFAGVIQGDRLYGRGAMDFKGGLAAFTVAAMRLAREGAPRTRDLILLAEADEEGGSYGTTWLAENHWAKIDASESHQRGRLDLRRRVRRRAADGHHDDRQELAVGDVPHARDLDALLPAAARQRAAPARPRARSRRALRHRAADRRRPRASTCAPGRAPRTRRPRGGCARSPPPAVPRSAPPVGRPAARRPVGRAVRRAAAQHLRADDRRGRVPGQRPPRHRRGDGEHAHAARPEAAAADPRAPPRGRRPEGADHPDRQRRRHGRPRRSTRSTSAPRRPPPPPTPTCTARSPGRPAPMAEASS